MPPSKINVIPTSYQDVMTLLKSENLRTVEDGIASRVGMPVVREYLPVIVNLIQAEISLSGMTASQIESFLNEYPAQIIAFGIRFLRDAEATRDEEEYPEGEEPGEEDKPTTVEIRGLGTGFGITYAIYYNFLANRPSTDFREFLKNRRISHHARFAKEISRVFDETTLEEG
jgi:hypothetical protein